MCDISTLSKYKNRPSPPRPANDLPCRGKVFIGNDGMYWKSSQTSNGVYRWVKQSDDKSPTRKSKSPTKSPTRKSKSATKSPTRKSKSPTRKSKSPTRKSKSPTRKSKSPASGRLSSYRVYLISNRKIPVSELTKTSKVHDITLKASHFKAKAEYYKDKDSWEIECSETISHNPQDIKKWAKSLSGVKSVKVAHTNYL